jgi:hypothetical protein
LGSLRGVVYWSPLTAYDSVQSLEDTIKQIPKQAEEHTNKFRPQPIILISSPDIYTCLLAHPASSLVSDPPLLQIPVAPCPVCILLIRGRGTTRPPYWGFFACVGAQVCA